MSEKDEEEKIKHPKPTKEEVEAARKFIKSCITKRERLILYACAAGDALLKVAAPFSNKFSSSGYMAAAGAQGAESASSVSGNLFSNKIGKIAERISLRVKSKIMRHYYQRPGMEQQLRNKNHIDNYINDMANSAGNYIRYNAQKVASWIGAGGGLALSAYSLHNAGMLTLSGLKAAGAAILASGTIPTAAVVAAGGLAGIICGQHLLQQKLKNISVESKTNIMNLRNDVMAKQREMLTNSQMQLNTNSEDIAYAKFEEAGAKVVNASNQFLRTLNRYGYIFDGIKLATAGVTMYVAHAAGMAIKPMLALTYGTSTVVAAANGISSATVHREEAQEMFASAFKGYAKGITNFTWGKEKLKSQCNALEIDRISYRYRNGDEKSGDFGKYGATEVFNVSQKISFGPGITSLSGASGAGKSTLMKLLRHQDLVPKGTIRIGNQDENRQFSGQDYRTLAYKEVHQQTAFASSMPELEECSVDAYIRKGNPNVDEEKIRKIKDLLEIETEYFDEKEQKMKPLTLTMAGNKSGGQLARLSLAQALIKDSQIMLLDEVTSGLDPRLSEKVCNHLKKLGDEGKTIIYITHKPEELNILKPYQNVDVGKHEEGQQINDIRQYPITNDEELQARIEFQRSRKAAEDKAKKEAEERAKQETEGKIQTSMDKVKEHILEDTENTKENQTNSDDYAKIISLNFPHAKSTQNNTEQNQLQAKIISLSSGGRP